MTHIDRLIPQQIERALAGQVFGQRVIYYPCIDSTNRAARELALQDEAHGWVVLADEQRAGRGRLERTWESQAGRDILASIIVYPDLRGRDVFQLTMMASVAVVAAVERVCGLTCGIKWPNDIFLNGKKLCGILSEGRVSGDSVQYMVIGIGINVNSSMAGRNALADDAISVRDAGGREHERSTIVIALLEEFNRLYAARAASGSERLRRTWEQHAIMIGRAVTIHGGRETLSGTAAGIMPDGTLIIREDSGREHLIACGDLSLRLE